MKKYLLLLASAALLLVGCAKENFAEQQEGELVTATFTASLDNSVATKAAVDGDGTGANVNRCIMEIYYGDDLYAREIKKVIDKKATFTAQVVSNREYTVAFWADMVDNAETKAGLAADKYYTATSLKEISFKKDVEGNIVYVGNDDARDAFFHFGTYTVAQSGSSWGDIKLYRPFAQMNVITTDWDNATSVTGLAPEKVKVTIKNALVKFNAVTGAASGSSNLEYEAAVYTAPAPVAPVSKTEKTLSMDYLFASSTTKEVIDIDWKALHTGDDAVEHSFAAVPYQRNYRTNIKGALLTTQGQWTVTVDPIWESDTQGEYEKLVVATTVLDIEGMNTFVAANPNADQIDVTFGKEPNDSGTPGTDDGAHAIVTSTLKESANLNVTVATNTNTLYVGDYPDQNTVSEIVESSKAAVVNITVPEGKKIDKLVINAPSKSVYLNGQQITSGVGTLTNVEATTSEHTLVVDAGQSIGTLIVHQGGLEIHGTVGTLKIEETAPEDNPVLVRTSENLSATVFAVIKGDTPSVHNYIDAPFFVEKQNGDKWDIVPSVVLAGSLDNPTAGYATLEQAITAETSATLFLTADIETTAEIVVGEGKDINLNLNGHNINSGNHPAFQILGGKLNIVGAGEIVGTHTPQDARKEIWLKGSTDANASDYSVLSVGPQVTIKCVGGYAVMISQNNGSAYGVKIDIQGTVEGEYGALYVNGSIQKTTGNVPEITVKGKLSNPDAAAVYAAGYAKYVFEEGADVSGLSSMYICGGDIVINGGTFTGFGPAVEFVETSNEYGSTGEAIVVDSREGYVKPIKLCIKGGDFTSEHNRPVGSYPVGNETKRFIQGGTFSAELPELYIDEGYNQVRIPNGKYLVQGKTAAHLNGHDYITIAKALEAFGEITEPGDYDLTIEPGIYRESDLMLIIQNPQIIKKLTVKPVGEAHSVKIMPGDKSEPLALFVIGAHSSYNGGGIVIEGIDIDMSDTPTPATGRAVNYLSVFYLAGTGSGDIDGVVEDLCPGMYNGQNNPRYVHDLTIRNCDIVGNGINTKVLQGNTGTSGITVENCTASKFGYFADGYFTDNSTYGWKGLTIKGGNYVSEKVFVNRQNGPHTMIIEDCTVSAKHDYVIRVDGGDFTVNNCNLTSLYEGSATDAGIIVARMKNEPGITNIMMEGCEFVKQPGATTKDIYCISGTVTLNGQKNFLTAGNGANIE